LINKGSNPDTTITKLGQCEGNCTSSSDCDTGLICSNRSEFELKVHGCAFGGTGDVKEHNYCYKPPNSYKFDKAFIEAKLSEDEDLQPDISNTSFHV